MLHRETFVATHLAAQLEIGIFGVPSSTSRA